MWLTVWGTVRVRVRDRVRVRVRVRVRDRVRVRVRVRVGVRVAGSTLNPLPHTYFFTHYLLLAQVRNSGLSRWWQAK